MPRVIVTDAQERAVLGTLRCLREEGLDVSALATGRAAPGFWSRAPDRRFVIPNPGCSIEGFVSRLEQILAAHPHDVMMAGADAALLVISEHRERLERHVRLGLPSHEVVQAALDRARLAQAADHAGLGFPESRVCQDEGQALAAAKEFGLPVLAKPVHVVVPVNGAAERWGIVLAHSLDEVTIASRRFGSCMIQRPLAGKLLSVSGVATERGLIGAVVGWAMRTWPPDAGNGTFCKTIAPPSGLLDRVQAFLAEIGWLGLFQLELIAADDGRLAAIDFNPRAYGSLGLAVAAGVPLPALWCEWVLGRDPVAAEPRLGTRYRWEDGDLRYAARKLADGRLRPTVKALVPRSGVAHAYFQLHDPAPAVARAWQLARLSRERARADGRLSDSAGLVEAKEFQHRQSENAKVQPE